VPEKDALRSPLIRQVLFRLNRLFFENNRFNRYFSKMLTPPSRDHDDRIWKWGIWAQIEPGTMVL